MPRGLGEDPLSRQRKGSKRFAAQSASASHSSQSASAVATEQGPPQGAVVDASSSRPASYNDVFFRKRSEGAAVASGSGASQEPSDLTVSPSAAAQQPVPGVEASALPESEPAEAMSAAPAAPSVPIAAPEAHHVQQDAQFSAPVVQSTEAAANPPPADEKADGGNPTPQQGGLLKRIFGKFRK